MHPLGLNLDFLFGRGYLSARQRSLGGWATIESLRMEIPDLSFPFDARGGVDRFRHTRSQVRHIEMTISESALQAALSHALEDIQGFEELRVRFGDNVAHTLVRLRTLGSDTFLTFKVGVIPPEPARGDALHVLFYDVRSYGPVPYPARLMVAELIARLLTTETLARPGHDKLYRVEQDGDLLELRPLKLGLMSLFPPQGWKMPSLAGVRYENIALHPGALHLSAHSDGAPWERPDAPSSALSNAALSGPGAASALAAYEARALCRDADAALFDSQVEASLDALHGLRERYGAHPAISSRLLDTLLASSGTGHLSEARALVEELMRANPDDLHAHLAAPTIASLRGDSAGAVAAYKRLADLLRRRGERTDLIACLLAAAMVQQRHDPDDAILMLREVTQHDPRQRLALELLRDLHRAQDQPAQLVDALRRLASLHSDREQLLRIYQELAERLMARRDLDEARRVLEKILRLDPEHMGSLEVLGESYMLDDQPLRALKAWGAAAQSAEKKGNAELAAQLHVRLARLWADPLGDPDGALLAIRRALTQVPSHRVALNLGVTLAVAHDRQDDALDFLDALTPLAEADVEHNHDTGGLTEALVEARRVHLLCAELATRRGREETAASHHRQALTYRHTSGYEPLIEDDPSVLFLDQYNRRMGQPEALLDLYRRELKLEGLSHKRRASLHRSLATLFDEVIGLGSEAIEHVKAALEADPEDEAALTLAVTLMTRDGHHFALRELLKELDMRVGDRRLRGLIQRHHGELHLEALPDPAEATRILRQAMLLRPADPQTAARLIQAERALLRHDPQTTVHGLLKALERLGEIGLDEQTRVEAMTEAGDLYYERLTQPTRAASFYERAQALRPDPRLAERLRKIRTRAGYTATPHKLDAVTSPLSPEQSQALQSPTTTSSPPSGGPYRVSAETRWPSNPTPVQHVQIRPGTQDAETRDTPHRGSTTDFGGEEPSDELTSLSEAVHTALGGQQKGNLSPPTVPLISSTAELEASSSSSSSNLQAFRDRIQAAHRTPRDLASGLAVLDHLHPERNGGEAHSPDPHDEPLSQTRAVPALRTAELPMAAFPPGFQPKAVADIPEPPELLIDPLSIDESELEPPSYEPPTPMMEASSTSLSPNHKSPNQQTLAKLGIEHETTFSTTATRPIEALKRTSPNQALRRDALMERIAQARDSGDPGRLRDALEEALDEGDDLLSAKARPRLSRELGLLYYYELEQLNAAEEWLNKACALDPEGVGRDFDVLTALEGVYEDLGRPEALLDIYLRKQQHAQEPRMKQVYALLSAELLWERLNEPQRASETLKLILDDEPHNAPALRMLSDISQAQQDFDAAVLYLRRIIGHNDSGDFELQDTLRELGGLLTERLHTLEMAPIGRSPDEDTLDELRRDIIKVYRRLLKEAPGDSTAIATLKPLLEQTGQLQEALAILGMELGTLIGRRDGFPTGPTAQDIDIENIVTALALPVSQILTEAAALKLRLGALEDAEHLYHKALQGWRDNIDALNGHTEVLFVRLSGMPEGDDARRDVAQAIVTNQELLAQALLAPQDKLSVLLDASELILSEQLNPEIAERLMVEALKTARDITDPDPRLRARIKDLHARLQALNTSHRAALTERRTSGSSGSLPPHRPDQDNVESQEDARAGDEHDGDTSEPLSGERLDQALLNDDLLHDELLEEPFFDDDTAREREAHAASHHPSPAPRSGSLDGGSAESPSHSSHDQAPLAQHAAEQATLNLTDMGLEGDEDHDGDGLPGGLLPIPPLRRPDAQRNNPFGLPGLERKVDLNDVDELSQELSQHVEDERPSGDERHHVWSGPSQITNTLGDLNLALQDAERAERDKNTAALIDALRRANQAARQDDEAPPMLRRQLALRLAEVLLGLRPVDQEATRELPVPSRLEEALALTRVALTLNDDEPEAHFAQLAALRGLGRYQEALDALETLTALANRWIPEPDTGSDPTPPDALARRLLNEARAILRDAGLEAQSQTLLHRLVSLNANLAHLVQRMEDD